MDKETLRRFKNFIGDNLKTLPIAQIGANLIQGNAQKTPEIAEESQKFLKVTSRIKEIFEKLYHDAENFYIKSEEYYEELKSSDKEMRGYWRGKFIGARKGAFDALTFRNELTNRIKSPYFGRIDFKFNEEAEFRFRGQTMTVYLGKKSLELGGEERISDWRAPIASLYYNFAKPTPDAFYKVGKDLITGELTKKHMIEIKDAVLEGVFDAADVQSLVGADPFLIEQLKGKSSAKLKDIVSSIQAEQNKIISADLENDIIVQGVAGSGKTSIATHRLSWLLYNYKDELKASKCMIVAPSKLFLSYIAEILPEIGSEKVPQKTFEEWAFEKLKDYVKEASVDVKEDERKGEKGSIEHMTAVGKLADRLKKNAGKLVAADVLGAYKKEFSIDKITLADLASLVLLKAKIFGVLTVERLDYLVVDEAQDYSPSQLLALRTYIKEPGRMLIVGDVMQGIINKHGVKDWFDLRGGIFDPKKLSLFNIQTSYRTTKQIVEFVNEFLIAQNVLEKYLPKAVLREGPIPEIYRNSNLEEFLTMLPGLIQREKIEERKNIVIIVPKEYIQMFNDEISKVVPDLHLIDEPTDLYTGGVILTDVKTVKGLEFDSVIFVDNTNLEADDLTHVKQYYVACTRAMHKLYIFEV